MTEPRLVLRRLVEHVLGKGKDLSLALLLEHFAPVAELRRLTRKFDLSPKGFRIDRAPARVLATQLAEHKDSAHLEEVLALLDPRARKPAAKDATSSDAARTDAEALLRLRETELVRLRAELERARASLLRGGEREAELVRSLERVEQDLLRRRSEQSSTASASGRRTPDRSAVQTALERRVRDLEHEREGFVAADEALRRQLAHNQSRLRQLEAANAELEELVPKARRRKKRPLPAPPLVERRVLVPRFLPSFYKSLIGKERKAVERAIMAIMLFCTEGHAYPGLEVKQLGGQDTWSLRASLGLRVYFRPLPDGDIEVLELGDREDQHTTLRRLKEK